MVYDITSYDSYRNIKKWMREVKDYSENGVLLILIGNKSDLKDHREVGYEEAQKFAEKECMFIEAYFCLEIPFIETSAFSATNVDVAFKKLIYEIYK